MQFSVTYSKVKVFFDYFFLRTTKCKQLSRNFSERFETFRKTEVYFLGDFNINLFVDDKFVLKEN